MRFIQTWIVPAKSSLDPNYGSYEGTNCDLRKNQLQHLVSDVRDKTTSTPVQINQAVNAFATELELGKKVTYELPHGRQAYLLCVEGGVTVNGKQLRRHDACEITGPNGGSLEIEATATEETENGSMAHVLMYTMPATPGAGRRDL